MLISYCRWMGRLCRAVGQRKGTDPWLQVSPSVPPGWPTGRCSCSGQDPAGSKWPDPPSTGTKQCLEKSRRREAGWAIISIGCLQLKVTAWRRRMSKESVTVRENKWNAWEKKSNMPKVFEDKKKEEGRRVKLWKKMSLKWKKVK